MMTAGMLDVILCRAFCGNLLLDVVFLDSAHIMLPVELSLGRYICEAILDCYRIAEEDDEDVQEQVEANATPPSSSRRPADGPPTRASESDEATTAAALILPMAV